MPINTLKGTGCSNLQSCRCKCDPYLRLYARPSFHIKTHYNALSGKCSLSSIKLVSSKTILFSIKISLVAFPKTIGRQY